MVYRSCDKLALTKLPYLQSLVNSTTVLFPTRKTLAIHGFKNSVINIDNIIKYVLIFCI